MLIKWLLRDAENINWLVSHVSLSNVPFPGLGGISASLD